MRDEKIQKTRLVTPGTPGLLREGSIIAGFSIIAVGVVMQFYLLVPVPDVLRTLFDLSEPRVLNLTAVFGLSYAAGLLVWGRLATVFSPRSVMLAGLLLLCVASLGLALPTEYASLISLRVVQGFVAAAFPPAVILWCAEHISPPRRVLAIACISCGFLLSASLGQAFGAAVIRTSLMPAMGTAALVYAGGALLVACLPRRASGPSVKPRPFLQDLGEIARQGDVLKVYVLTFFLFNSLIVFYSGVAGPLRPLLVEHGIDPAWFRAVAVPGLMLSLLVPPFIRRFGSLQMVWFSALLLAAGHALQLLAAVLPGVWVYGAHGVYAAGIGFAIPSLISFISLGSPPRIKGTAVSLYMFILFFGGGAGSFLISYTGVVPMMTAQVIAFVLIVLWLGTDLVKRRKRVFPLAVVAVFLPLLAGAPAAALAAQSPVSMENALTYYKDLSPGEQHEYTNLFVASGKKTSGTVKTEAITLYRWQRTPEFAPGHDNVSIQVTDTGLLTGFARYIPAAAAEPLPSREETEKTAREFLETYAPDLLPVMNIEWINPHRDETYTDGKTTWKINGMKMKCRNTADGTWFWVIVGSDNTVIVFERDIEWDFIRAGRQTEKWLHDDWLVRNKVRFTRG